MFLENDSGQSAGGGLTVNAPGTTATGWIVDNTFVANTGSFASHLHAPTLTGTLANNLFVSARGGGAAVEVAATVVSDHNGWFDNGTDLAGTSFGASEVFGDPLFAGWVDDGDCTNDDLTLLPGSPGIDAGDPAFPERDGTPGDLGAG